MRGVLGAATLMTPSPSTFSRSRERESNRQQDSFDIGAGNYTPQTAGSVAEVLAMFDKNVPLAETAIRPQTLDRLSATWRITNQGQVIMEMPRMGVIRSLLLNHLIHHRGQLSVYLRLKDVPLPSIYGPTADTPM